MKLRCSAKSVLAIVMLGAASIAQASSLWDEAADGDLSDDGLSPTPLLASLGSNTVLGETGNAGAGVDRDYFSIAMPIGMTLSSIMVVNNTFVSGGSSFIGIQSGPQLTVSPGGAGAENLLGFAHYGNDQIGQDLLPFFGITGGLPSGTYSVWVQELGGVVSYGFDFAATPVPLPGAAWLLIGGLLGLARLNANRNEKKK